MRDLDPGKDAIAILIPSLPGSREQLIAVAVSGGDGVRPWPVVVASGPFWVFLRRRITISL